MNHYDEDGNFYPYGYYPLERRDMLSQRKAAALMQGYLETTNYAKDLEKKRIEKAKKIEEEDAAFLKACGIAW